jgi:hypothetical protein
MVWPLLSKNSRNLFLISTAFNIGLLNIQFWVTLIMLIFGPLQQV